MASLTPYTQALGKKNAAHLLRRTSFGATKQEIDQFANKTSLEAIELLFKRLDEPPLPRDTATGSVWIPSRGSENSQEAILRGFLNNWWIHHMVSSPLSIHEKMAFFMHTHFTSMGEKVRFSTHVYFQIKLFRHYALGNFKELAKKICLDNAMIHFLDGHLNLAEKPNENFAREFLELYTIGKGPQRGPNDYTTYTEDDVREAAKVFSGWQEDHDYTNIDPVTKASQGIPIGDVPGVAVRHDATTKKFSAAFNNQTIAPNEKSGKHATTAAATDEINQFVEMVFAQPATAEHICRKLYRFFVYYKITKDVESNIIKPLAKIFQDNNYEIEPVLKALFTSQHFYHVDNSKAQVNTVGALIKSPLDLTLGTLRFLRCVLPGPNGNLKDHYNAYHKTLGMDRMGLDFYDPFDVAGYEPYHQSPGYHRLWITSNYLALRYEFAKRIIKGVKKNDRELFRFDVVAYVDDSRNISDPFDARTIVQELVDYLLPQTISKERFEYFLNAVLLDGLSEQNWATEWQNYQGSGDDAPVRVQLENLFNTILQSPEYQLS